MAIQINDLRCGNYVRMGSEKWWIVTQVNTGFIKAQNPNDEDNWGNLTSLDFNGIPITKELLIDKCGAHIRNESSWVECNIYIDEERKLQLIIDDRGMHVLFFKSKVSIHICDIQYLHQLQNIYYPLAGQEMAIKF